MTRAKKSGGHLVQFGEDRQERQACIDFATQSPTKDVITSEIQNNLNTKIAFAVSDYVHSQVIFKTAGAENCWARAICSLKARAGSLPEYNALMSTEIQNVVKSCIDNNEAYFDQAISDAILRRQNSSNSGCFRFETKAWAPRTTLLWTA